MIRYIGLLILASLACVLATSTVAWADATVVIQHSLETAAGVTDEGSSTTYYSGKFSRIQAPNGAVAIYDARSGRLEVVYNGKRTTFMAGTSGIDAIQRLLRPMCPDIKVDVRVVPGKIIQYSGHKCRIYTYHFRLYSEQWDGDLASTGCSYVAIDLPGVDTASVPVHGVREFGAPIAQVMAFNFPQGSFTIRAAAVSISTRPLPHAIFAVDKSFVQDPTDLLAAFDARQRSTSARRSVAAPGSVVVSVASTKSADQNDTMDAVTKPLSADAELVQAHHLMDAGHFTDLALLVRDAQHRGIAVGYGPIYNALGDNAVAAGQNDIAWGWYSLAVAHSTVPAEIIYAHFALAQYYTAAGKTSNAQKELQAIIRLPAVDSSSRSKAQDALAHLNTSD